MEGSVQGQHHHLHPVRRSSDNHSQGKIGWRLGGIVHEFGSVECWNLVTLILIGCLGTPSPSTPSFDTAIYATLNLPLLAMPRSLPHFILLPMQLFPTTLTAIIMSLFKRVTRFLWKQALAPKPLSTRPYPTLNASTPLEEENMPHCNAADWYPVFIGELFESRYQVLGKLGFGLNSTIYISRYLQ